MRLALYQPDIPQNTGTILRLAACLSIGVDIIEPCGFPFDDKRLRRSGMDYIDDLDISRHPSWNIFFSGATGRIILLTTKGATPLTKFRFEKSDVILLGRESAGVPDLVHNQSADRILIPMAPGKRSLNVAVAAAIALGEGLRQTDGFPGFFSSGKSN